MTLAEIRALYMETLAGADLASVSFIAHDGMSETHAGCVWSMPVRAMTVYRR